MASNAMTDVLNAGFVPVFFPQRTAPSWDAFGKPRHDKRSRRDDDDEEEEVVEAGRGPTDKPQGLKDRRGHHHRQHDDRHPPHADDAAGAFSHCGAFDADSDAADEVAHGRIAWQPPSDALASLLEEGDAPATSPYLSSRQQRVAAWLRNHQPFACQQPPPSRGLSPGGTREQGRHVAAAAMFDVNDGFDGTDDDGGELPAIDGGAAPSWHVGRRFDSPFHPFVPAGIGASRSALVSFSQLDDTIDDSVEEASACAPGRPPGAPPTVASSSRPPGGWAPSSSAGGPMPSQSSTAAGPVEGAFHVVPPRRATSVGCVDDGVSPGDAPTADRSSTASAARDVPLNDHLVRPLLQLKDVYHATGDQWRHYAYNKAVAVISRLPFRVVSVDQLRGTRALGSSILSKIEEILASGTAAKLDNLKRNPEVIAVEQLTKIWGVGATTARKLFHLGYRSVADLRATPSAQLSGMLSAAQLVGLRHVEELQERIPRAEVEAIEGAVRGILMKLKLDSVVELTTCGSYRRGKTSSGDVDILLCDRTGRTLDGVLDLVVHSMKAQAASHQTNLADTQTQADKNCRQQLSFSLVEELTYGRRSLSSVSHADSWFGVVQLAPCNEDDALCYACHRGDTARRLPCVASGGRVNGEQGLGPSDIINQSGGCDSTAAANGEPRRPLSAGGPQTRQHLARRLDIKVYPKEQYPFAVMYFTGSDYFNRSVRLYAQKQGFSLSDKELRPVVRARGDKVHEGAGIECATERDIFVALGLPYRHPHERDIFS